MYLYQVYKKETYIILWWLLFCLSKMHEKFIKILTKELFLNYFLPFECFLVFFFVKNKIIKHCQRVTTTVYHLQITKNVLVYKKIEKPARKLLVIPIGNKNIRNANSIQKKNTPVCWYNENKSSKVYQSKKKKYKYGLTLRTYLTLTVLV